MIGRRLQAKEKHSPCKEPLSIRDLHWVPPTASMKESLRRLKNMAHRIHVIKEAKPKNQLLNQINCVLLGDGARSIYIKLTNGILWGSFRANNQ